MTRGITETVRGQEKDWPEQRSQIGKRNASEADLSTARNAIGKTLRVNGHTGKPSPLYRIADVRLDSLNRLIVDLVLVESEEGHAHNDH
jgi:hypothetical protein